MNEPGCERADGADCRRGSRVAFGGGSRVAFFGGSFDPPHLGHLAVARAAYVAFRLDTVLFAPVGAQPLKPEGSAASFKDRVEMTRLAIEGEVGFRISLADAPKPTEEHQLAPNYTIDTLQGLRARLGPDCSLFCLMGADSFFGLSQWHRASEIPFAAPLIVASRPGQTLGQTDARLRSALPAGLTLEPEPEGDETEAGVEVRAYVLANATGRRTAFYLLPGLDVEISATEIREGIREGIRAQDQAANESLSTSTRLLPLRVADYIRSRGLYR